MGKLAVAGSNTAVSSSYVRVDADILIPGRGDPIKKGTLVCGSSLSGDGDEKGTILYVGSTTDVPHKYSNLSVTKVPVLSESKNAGRR